MYLLLVHGFIDSSIYSSKNLHLLNAWVIVTGLGALHTISILISHAQNCSSPFAVIIMKYLRLDTV
jgi:hypothetical protein